MALGLKRGTVALQPHSLLWEENAAAVVEKLKAILSDTAVDVQHIGSTAIRGIHAKPIIDLVIGVRRLEDILGKKEALEENGVIFRGQDHPGQYLFVMGDFELDTRTHYVHVVEWGGAEWTNYVNFRDYLNAFPEKAETYDQLKQALFAQYADDRGKYTGGKQELIDQLLREAADWRNTQ